MKFIILITLCFGLLSGLAARAAEEVPQSFTLDGRLADSSGTVLQDTGVFTIRILDQNSTCILYEEQQSFDTRSTAGKFNIRVGEKASPALKRSVNDSGYTLSKVFANDGSTIAGKLLSNGAACSTPASAGAVRLIQITVTPTSDPTPRVMTAFELNSVPSAIVAERAESLGGVPASGYLRANATAPNALSQSNLENIFSTTNYTRLTDLLNGGSSSYVHSGANGSIQAPSISGTPSSPVAGQIWYDAGVIKYYDGSTTQALSAGSGITSLTIGAGLTPTGTISTGGSTIAVDVGTTTGKIVQMAASNKLPAVDGSNLTNVVAAGLSGTASISTTGTIASGAMTSSGAITGTETRSNSVKIYKPSTTNYVELVAPSSLSLPVTYTLPGTAPGVAGYVLSSDTSGNLSWVAQTSAGLAAVSNTASLANGKTWIGDGSGKAQEKFIGVADVRSTVGGNAQFFPTNCTAGQTLTWSSGTDTMVCTNISISGSQVSGTVLNGGQTGAVVAGTTDANSLTLKTNNTTRMTISSGGSIGIGTSPSTSKLHVVDTYPMRLDLGSAAEGPIRLRTYQDTYTTEWGLGQTGTSLDFALRYWDGSAWNERFRVASSGNVGIGVSGPASLLDARKDQDSATWFNVANQSTGTSAVAGFTAFNNGSGIAVGVTGNSASGVGTYGAANEAFVRGSASAAGLNINAANSSGYIRLGVNSSEKVRIDSSGNVGIGTTTPGKKLDIVGSNAELRISHSTTTGQGYVQFGQSATATQNFHMGSEGDGSFRLFNGDWGAGTSMMTVLSSGNVGVGTGTPGDKLHVNGKIRATHICYTDGTNCKDISTAWTGGGGTVTSVVAGTGLTGGTITGSGTIGLGTELTGVNGLSTTGFVKRTGAGAYSTATSISLTADVTGTLPIANGGTNSATTLNNNRLMVSSSGAIVESAAMTDGQFVVGKTGAAPQLVTMSGDATVSNLGAVTLKNTGTAGTYRSVTTDAQGRVTAGTNPTTLSGYGITDAVINGGQTGAVVAGTTDANSLTFKTNGVDRVTVTSGGNFGIGTTSPGAPLEVNGAAKFGLGSGSVDTSPILTLNGERVWMFEQGGSGSSASVNLRSNTDLKAFKFISQDRSNTAMTVYTANTAANNYVLLAPTGGNVGIGTTSANNRLEVKSAGASTSPFYIQNSAGTAMFDISESSGNAGTLSLKDSSGTATVRLHSSGITTFNGGNVGVGLADPGVQMEVQNNLRVRSTSGSFPAITRTMDGLDLVSPSLNLTTALYGIGVKFMSKDTDFTTETPKLLAGIFPRATEVYNADTKGGMAIDFMTSPNGVGATSVPSTRMTIDQGGNVGIGTTAPTSKLEVVGDVQLQNGGAIYSKSSGGTTTTMMKMETYDYLSLGWGPINGIDFYNGGTLRMRIQGGNVGIGTATPGDMLHVNGKIRATHICYTDGTNCKDISTAWTGGGGTVTSITAGTGLTGGTITGSGTIGLGTVPVANGGTNSTTALNNNRLMVSSGSAIVEAAAMTDGQIVVGKTGAAPQLVAMSGDATVSNTGAVSVTGLRGKTVSATAPTTAGQVLRYDGTNWTPNFISMFDLRSTVTGAAAFGGVGCLSNQTLTWTAATDNLACSDISLPTSQLSGNVSLTSQVTGTLPVANGGTGVTSLPGTFVLNGGQAGAITAGPSDSNVFAFQTGGTERMRIGTSGRVAIGTTAASTLVHIDGGSSAGGEVTVSGQGSAETAANIIFSSDTGTNMRGSGIFMFDTNGQTEWFAGRPYTGGGGGTDAFTIGRKSSVASHTRSTANIANAFFTVTSAGNVGIGTTTPSYKFHVVGDDSTAATDNVIMEVTGTKSGAGATNSVGLRSKPIVSAATGTTTNNYGVLSLPTNSGAGTITNAFGLYSRIDNTSSGTITNAYGLYLPAATNSGTITNNWAIYQGDANAKNYFAGNVGIGTASTTYNLHVYGTGAGVTEKVETTSTAHTAGLWVESPDSGVQIMARGAGNAGTTTDGTTLADAIIMWDSAAKPASKMILGTQNSVPLHLATNTTVRMTVDAAGNVGIGSSSPGQRLDVSGNVKISGQVKTGSLVVSGGTNSIDWNNGNTIRTDYNCGSAISFANLQDGATYTLIVTDTGTTQCSFSTTTTGTDAATVTYRFKPANASRTATSHSIYTFIRSGTIVYVNWTSGF